MNGHAILPRDAKILPNILIYGEAASTGWNYHTEDTEESALAVLKGIVSTEAARTTTARYQILTATSSVLEIQFDFSLGCW